MSFFGRAANLVRGSFKSLTRLSLTRPTKGADARERALEEELARYDTPGLPPPEASRTAARPLDTQPGGAPQPEDRAAPERDELGNVKRTL